MGEGRLGERTIKFGLCRGPVVRHVDCLDAGKAFEECHVEAVGAAHLDWALL